MSKATEATVQRLRQHNRNADNPTWECPACGCIFHKKDAHEHALECRELCKE